MAQCKVSLCEGEAKDEGDCGDYIPTVAQKADVLTKVPPHVKHVAALAQLGIVDRSEVATQQSREASSEGE